jgi:hypothetical protein
MRRELRCNYIYNYIWNCNYEVYCHWPVVAYKTSRPLAHCAPFTPSNYSQTRPPFCRTDNAEPNHSQRLSEPKQEIL